MQILRLKWDIFAEAGLAADDCSIWRTPLRMGSASRYLKIPRFFMNFDRTSSYISTFFQQGIDIVTHPYYRAMQFFHIVLSIGSVVLIVWVLKKYRKKFIFHYNIRVGLISFFCFFFLLLFCFHFCELYKVEHHSYALQILVMSLFLASLFHASLMTIFEVSSF